ncbi:deoxyribodipyrimidine photo-lyase [Shimwellia pseudoproteus]|uniref:deoxyribodipyrimidine photo-lyase n=1 Tax=Shimwellia pseudoproteus TaxID=570012 RepID=UPI0018EE1597|nr:deoxyribodipyrimidine photo-lyase [Shimwellia pseudoproteus]MBJ3814502.1 deoxyribodipyrimidine photo-lyase [Shimwellia pseudoproteus]
MATHLVWFRLDLRIEDNLALAAACRDPDARVMAVFIVTPRQWQQHHMAPRQHWWIEQHVRGLHQALAARQIPLHCITASDYRDGTHRLVAFCRQHRVDRLFYNYQYEVNERDRDAQLEHLLAGQVVCQGFDDSVLLAPGSITTGSGGMYKVFTPFSRACLQRLRVDVPYPVAAPGGRQGHLPQPVAPPLPFSAPSQPVDGQLFAPGEAAARERLTVFCQQRLADYPGARDYPALDGVSGLSPWLAIGALSPRQCLHQALLAQPDALSGGPGLVWVTELLWREFYRHLLVAWPDLCRHRPFIPWTDNIVWSRDQTRLKAWQSGHTGYPIVDAAMRQLNHTGWMHNRLRMISASFLVKDLLIDWRAGERYFISTLVDGDLAANNGGWQWSASTGTDAAPYFRIFNPTTQGARFDPEGVFIRRWLPELAHVPGSEVHQPWRWAQQQGVTLDYPPPIVEHKLARAATLEAYQAARQPTGEAQ